MRHGNIGYTRCFRVSLPTYTYTSCWTWKLPRCTASDIPGRRTGSIGAPLLHLLHNQRILRSRQASCPDSKFFRTGNCVLSRKTEYSIDLHSNIIETRNNWNNSLDSYAHDCDLATTFLLFRGIHHPLFQFFLFGACTTLTHGNRPSGQHLHFENSNSDDVIAINGRVI